MSERMTREDVVTAFFNETGRSKMRRGDTGAYIGWSHKKIIELSEKLDTLQDNTPSALENTILSKSLDPNDYYGKVDEKDFGLGSESQRAERLSNAMDAEKRRAIAVSGSEPQVTCLKLLFGKYAQDFKLGNNGDYEIVKGIDFEDFELIAKELIDFRQEKEDKENEK